MVAKVHLQVPYHKYMVINAPPLSDCTVYATLQSQHMRCLNKHMYHCSALLGPVTVGSDAVFFYLFFFQLQAALQMVNTST